VQSSSYAPVAVETRVAAASASSASGSGDWIASELLQLREQSTSPSFDRMSRLVQYRVSACWHRGHLGLRCFRFADDGFCQRFDARRFCPTCSSASRMTFLSNRLVHRAIGLDLSRRKQGFESPRERQSPFVHFDFSSVFVFLPKLRASVWAGLFALCPSNFVTASVASRA
jgi:hypothetical protein